MPNNIGIIFRAALYARVTGHIQKKSTGRNL